MVAVVALAAPGWGPAWAFGAAEPLVDAPPSLGLSGSEDEVVCRVHIPNADRRHGEVRLVRGDDAVAVQTLLYTPSLRRGLHQIRQREAARWPPARAGHADSQKYLDVLARAKPLVIEAFDRREEHDDPRQKMLIEVMQHGTNAWVIASVPELFGADDAVEIRGTRPVAMNPVSTHYSRAAMETILQSAFHQPGRTLDEFLSGQPVRAEPLSDEQLSQPVPR